MTGQTGQAPAGEPPTLEVRWIRPGVLDARILEWFRRYPAATEVREDDYQISPNLEGLSVKIRGGWALDVKMYRGGRGALTVMGQVRGSWRPGSDGRFRLPGWFATLITRRR